ncbi:MAG: alpha-L-fucosidase, partial [Actinomycetota bacterium]
MAPSWWAEHRLGVFVAAGPASVPAWAPVGEQAHEYRLGLDGDGSLLAPRPETLAHHRDRWGHVARFDDLVELLTFEAFDPDSWVDAVRSAGAAHLVVPALDQDGWAWWAAPGIDRSYVHVGPRRDLLRPIAAAAERAGLPLGAELWPAVPGQAFDHGAIDHLHRASVDLVDRYGVSALRASGTHHLDVSSLRADELCAELVRLDPTIAVDDGWGLRLDEPGAFVFSSRHDRELPRLLGSAGGDGGGSGTAMDGGTPAGLRSDRWELRIGLGASWWSNRAEPSDPAASADRTIRRVATALALGGHVLLAATAGPDGALAPDDVATLAAVGRWME